MPTVPLPDRPSLEQLRAQARDLQKAARSRRPDALALLALHLPGDEVTEQFPLHLAQLAVARRYGYRSWPRLVEHVEVVHRLSRFPGETVATGDPVDRFLGHAVLAYGEGDRPGRFALAREWWAADRSLSGRNIYTAAVTADHVAVVDILARDPAAARREGGPLRWEPLLYLTYSRLDPQVDIGDVLTTAGLLLQHGADPNAGYLWHGQPTPFTVLTGVFGEGEQGPVNQPAHPHQNALARLLLEAGAEANDGQALYNRMFQPGHSHLELLFDYGLGDGDGGPWHRLLPEDTDSPQDMLRAQLNWAISHGMVDRIDLLARHGVDLVTPLDSGHLPMVTTRTPLQVALLAGRRESVEALARLGVSVDDGDPLIAVVAALLDADPAALPGFDPGALARARTEYPSLVLRAAVADRPDAVKMLVDNGFDVNAYGRQDIVVEQRWETALHHAAGEGKLEMARLLVGLGADISLTDKRFHSTPLEWAAHLGQPELVAYLESVESLQGTDRAGDDQQ